MTLHTQLLAQIDQQLDQLLNRCRHLEAENQRLRDAEAQWHSERQRLIDKNTLACSRIESMISRLKQLEVKTP